MHIMCRFRIPTAIAYRRQQIHDTSCAKNLHTLLREGSGRYTFSRLARYSEDLFMNQAVGL